MLDLIAVADASAARRWLAAPLPDAELCVLRRGRLCGAAAAWTLSPALLSALRAAPTTLPSTLLVADDGGRRWRLRGLGDKLFALQSLDDSRERLLLQLRAALAVLLSGHIAHELRNPLNALSLQADLLAHRLERQPAPGERALAGVQAIKESTSELGLRQDAMVALWLADGSAPAAAMRVETVFSQVLGLLRSYFALQRRRLQLSGLDGLGGELPGNSGRRLQLGLLAVLLMSSVAADQATPLSVRVDRPAARLEVDIDAPLDGGALAAALRLPDSEAVLALVALVLDAVGGVLSGEVPALRIAMPVRV